MSSDELVSVKAIPGEYKRLFGRDVEFWDMVELLPIVLRGSLGIVPDYFFFREKITDCKLLIPCNHFTVNYACLASGTTFYNMQTLINDGQGILVNYNMDELRKEYFNRPNEAVINQIPEQALKVNSNFPQRANGQFIKFIKKGNVLEFEQNNIEVEVLVSSMPVDEKGIPLVTDKVVTAMAYFMNLVHVQKAYYRGKMPQYIFKDAQADYDFYLGEASIPGILSENDVNDILNTLSSFNRHSFNAPLIP
jgi:hypothetical protein